MRLRHFCFILCLLLAGCTLGDTPNASHSSISVTVETTELNQQEAACSGAFVTHELDHMTTVPGGENVRMFEANGGGVAINDLDNDGDLDIVLANHAEPNTILWNEGELVFRTERMSHGDSRAANIVDVDGDGWLDIVFSRRVTAPNYWHNTGDGTFSLELLPFVDKPLYAIDWADLDGDNDLDLVGGTYDAALLAEFGEEFLSSNNAGVYYYENQDGNFVGTRLAENAQALALALHDLDGDGRLDIVVGNDFAVPDYAWMRSDEDGEEWVETAAFPNTTHSTMSIDFGDVNNDGQDELFATDMKPFADDPETMAAWQPMMESMMSQPHPEGDPQLMENVLQVSGEEAGFSNEASAYGIDATGWSWSSKFGDLDQDGFLDLYVVNGFMEMTSFAHLPNHELVEENQAFRNLGNGRFASAPEWGLGALESGRGMSMADLDMDGDLDVVVNNLRDPAQLFENQLCQGNSVEVDLFWPDSGNSRGIGTRLTLVTDAGTYSRNVRAASGYLSGDPARIHFGLPDDAEVEGLVVLWPDGETTTVAEAAVNTLITVSRNE